MRFQPDDLLEPWFATSDDATALEAELARELCTGHPLFGLEMSAVARRQDCDDVLFVSTREPHIVVVVVHLTYSGRRETSHRMPWTTTFSSVQDWLARGMLADHQDIG